MLKISIIQEGKMKKGPLDELAHELIKRLGSSARVKVTVVKKITTLSLKQDTTTIFLSERGETMDSITFAQKLVEWSEHEQRELVFFISGPFGFDPTLLKKANRILSLSSMTFTHEMTYVILLEQLYRAGTILTGKTYHY